MTGMSNTERNALTPEIAHGVDAYRVIAVFRGAETGLEHRDIGKGEIVIAVIECGAGLNRAIVELDI